VILVLLAHEVLVAPPDPWKKRYARKNVVEPVRDAFNKPFPSQVVVGPGTQKLILDSRSDTESNLGNCSACELDDVYAEQLEKWMLLGL
jgi:hypothetical protein